MSQKQITIKDGKDIEKILLKNNCPVTYCKGSHRKGTLPDGQVLTFYDHGEFPPGIRRFFIKVLTGAGLLIFLLSSAFAFYYCFLMEV